MKVSGMEEKVFKDPVHQYIYVQDELIWDLINTREFQRLRRIRQLGTTYLTFHGAEHSRFSHSLGVYEITRKIISQFERNRYPDWPREERMLCLCAALLHDVGHGPFSHSIEPIFHVDHEEWSCEIILGDTEINRVLRKAGDDMPQKVADVIRKKYDQPIVIHLISSQLDADRMDYLLRDAYFTGVSYGTFDLDRILRVIRPHQGQIVVKESGMHAVEHYLMSRYQMYWQVYFHPVTRSAEILLRHILKRAKWLYTSGYEFAFMMEPLPALFEERLGMEQYLMLDESFMQMTLMQWTKESDGVLSDLCDRFINRRLFKYVSLDRYDEGSVAEFRNWMRENGLDPEYYTAIDYPADLPYDVYRPDEMTGKVPIMLLDEDGETVEITRRSDVILSISGLHKGTYKLYYPREWLTEHVHRMPRHMRDMLRL